MSDINFVILGDKFAWDVTSSEGKLTWNNCGDSAVLLQTLRESKERIIDSETTGLNVFLNEVFSLAFNIAGINYYANFQDYSKIETIEPDFVLGPEMRANIIEFLSDEVLWIGHNLKFDRHIIKNTFGVGIKGRLWDTMVIERLLENDHMKYNLASCVERNVPGFAKDDAVEEYIDQHGLYRTQQVFGKKKQFVEKFYHLVPFSIMAPYAARDGDVTRRLYLSQLKRIEEYKEKNIKFGPKLQDLVDMEIDLLSVCCDVEERGVLVDQAFCKEGMESSRKVVSYVEGWFKETYKAEFKDSVEELGPYLRNEGVEIGTTESGGESIKEDVLAAYPDNLLAKNILLHREHSKRANTYFQNFINLSKADGCLHPDMKQSGTRTGRFSYSDPNLQNIPKEDDSEFPIRRALKPRPGYFFFMPDYNQMEFRMMLDYAGEMELIDKIKSGHDPHQATADLTGLTRKAAKTLNFGLLYGMGIQKLANAIGVIYQVAKEFKWQYFRKLPFVKRIIYQSSDVAKARGFVYTWSGRKLDFPKPDFAYKAINGIIQGGCADVVKKAMIKQHKNPLMYGAEIVIQVHDEILFEVPLNDTRGMRFIVETMESIYPYRYLPLTVGLSYSLQSFYDAIDAKTFEEIDQAIGKQFEGEGKEVSGEPPTHMVC